MTDLASSRCIVMGAGGFIGTNLCQRLRGRVDLLRAFGRRQSFPDALEGIEWFPGDFADPTSIASAVDGCDTVFHLVNATTPASANADKIADIEANVISTLHLLEICRAEGVRKVIFVSSGGTIYGIPDQVPTPETAATTPITAYGISKLATEKYLSLFEYLHGLDYRVLRVANPYGPYQIAIKNQGVIAAFLRRALAGKPIEIWGDGSVTRDYVFIDDVTEALECAALHEGADRVFNIGSGEGRSLNDIVAAIEQVLGRQVNVQRREGRTVDVPRSILDTSLAARCLGWRARTDFLDGLARTVAWTRETL